MTYSLPLRLCAASVLALTIPQFALADPTVEFYGQLNFGLFNVDDGTESETFVSDNDNSNTRIGLRYSNELDWGATIKFNFETALGLDGSSGMTMDDNEHGMDMSRTEIRKLEIAYQTPSWGTLFLGQGSMSADGATEADFSGTTVASYVGVTDLAGGFAFRPKDGPESDTTVGNAFGTFDGSRRLRVRYDTPAFNGFVGSISYGEEELDRDDDRTFTDIGINYSNDYGDVKVDGRLAYQWIDDKDGTDDEAVAGSVAVLHKPSGVSLAVASGRPDEGDASYVFAKLGYQQNWFAVGTTALSIDIYDGSDFETSGSDSKTYAISAVQNVDAYNLELYASYRIYEYDAPGTDFEDIDLLLIGARWKF